MFSSFLSAYITAFEPVLRLCCCSWGFRNWKIPAVNLEGKPFHSASVPKETSRDLKHLLMGLLQRNHRERISFGKPLSRIYERICFRVWLLNLVVFFFFAFTEEFFHHPFLETSSPTKKCRNEAVLCSEQRRFRESAAADLNAQISSVSSAPMLSYPSSASASSSCSSSTSHLASPQVGIFYFTVHLLRVCVCARSK